jgi:hypothetical protein
MVLGPGAARGAACCLVLLPLVGGWLFAEDFFQQRGAEIIPILPLWALIYVAGSDALLSVCRLRERLTPALRRVLAIAVLAIVSLALPSLYYVIELPPSVLLLAPTTGIHYLDQYRNVGYYPLNYGLLALAGVAALLWLCFVTLRWWRPRTVEVLARADDHHPRGQ